MIMIMLSDSKMYFNAVFKRKVNLCFTRKASLLCLLKLLSSSSHKQFLASYFTIHLCCQSKRQEKGSPCIFIANYFPIMMQPMAPSQNYAIQLVFPHPRFFDFFGLLSTVFQGKCSSFQTSPAWSKIEYFLPILFI